MSDDFYKLVKKVDPASISLQERLIPCGKDNCSRCPHGVYYYAKYRDGQKVKSLYLGKSIPPEITRLLERKNETKNK